MSKQTTLRNDEEGVTWTIEPRGVAAVIEIRFDDDPDGAVTRERAMTAQEVESLIAEQLAAGFRRVAPFVPTPEWIRSAEDHEIALAVIDPWLLASLTDPALLDSAPHVVGSFVAVDTLVTQCRRNGLSSFVQEEDPRLVVGAPSALRALGLEDMAVHFEKATRDLDLGALAKRGARSLRFSDAGAAKALEHLASDPAVSDRLIAWVRAHAEAFAPPPPPRS